MGSQQLQALPPVALAGEVQLANASCALAALQLLRERLPVTRAAIDQGLRNVHLDGRLQQVIDHRTGIEWLLDVAHNTLSAQVLARHLATLPKRRTLAVFGIMADKDLDGIVAALSSHVEGWLPVQLPSARAMPANLLVERLQTLGVAVIPGEPMLHLAIAHASALADAKAFERVLVFGSFLTVGPALDWLAL